MAGGFILISLEGILCLVNVYEVSEKKEDIQKIYKKLLVLDERISAVVTGE